MVVLALISDPRWWRASSPISGCRRQPLAIAPARVPEDEDASFEGFFADTPFVDLDTPVGEGDDPANGVPPDDEASRAVGDEEHDDDAGLSSKLLPDPPTPDAAIAGRGCVMYASQSPRGECF